MLRVDAVKLRYPDPRLWLPLQADLLLSFKK
jgi:hypothetical protein